MSGQKIIEGLRDAIAGDFERVTIEGQTWVRKDCLDDMVKVLEELIDESTGVVDLADARAVLDKVKKP